MSRSKIPGATPPCKGRTWWTIINSKTAEWRKNGHSTMNQRKWRTWTTNRPWSINLTTLIIILNIGSTTTTRPAMGGFSPIMIMISRIINNKRKINPRCNLATWLICFSRAWVLQKRKEPEIGDPKVARAPPASRRTNRRSVTNKLRTLSNTKKSIAKKSQIKQARWARNKKQRRQKARKRKRP